MIDENQDLNGFVSGRDIAHYIVVSSLAYMSRLEIKNNLLQTSCILGLIEMYPETSDIFDSALNGRYKKMQESLSQIKNFLATDYFYSSDNVFDKIRSKNLQQYVAPYKVLDMRDIASAF